MLPCRIASLRHTHCGFSVCRILSRTPPKYCRASDPIAMPALICHAPSRVFASTIRDLSRPLLYTKHFRIQIATFHQRRGRKSAIGGILLANFFGQFAISHRRQCAVRFRCEQLAQCVCQQTVRLVSFPILLAAAVQRSTHWLERHTSPRDFSIARRQFPAKLLWIYFHLQNWHRS